jgi:hypothetical protein
MSRTWTDRVEKGQMHPANEPLLENFTKYPTPQETFDFLKEEVGQIRARWLAGELTEEDFPHYRMKLNMLSILKMWSWNYYNEEDYIHDQETVDWFNEAANV